MRAATIERPAFSKRRYTSPMRLALTPSGLTMDRVRSSGIRFGPLTKLHWVRVFGPACNAGARASREVYLGSSTRGNLACDGSAGLVRLFAPAKASGRRECGRCARAAPAGAQTEKLSPQPHSPLTFGFLKRKASFRPCLTKSTIV